MLTVFTVTKSDNVTFIVSSSSSIVMLASNWSWVLLIEFIIEFPDVPESTKTFSNNVSETPTSNPCKSHSGYVQIPSEAIPDT